jgi:hypothetical protein
MLLSCEKRDEVKAQEETQQKMRREAHRGDVQNITKILQKQSLANIPKPLSNKGKQNPVLSSALSAQTTTEEEQDAWRALGTSSKESQKAEETVKKKRAYVRKTQKGEFQGDSGLSKNKE